MSYILSLFCIAPDITEEFCIDEIIIYVYLSLGTSYEIDSSESINIRLQNRYAQLVIKSFEEARKLMAQVDSLKIVSLGGLKKGEKYQIRAKVVLGKFTLPFYLHYVLFFVSLRDFETDWHIINFIY